MKQKEKKLVFNCVIFLSLIFSCNVFNSKTYVTKIETAYFSLEISDNEIENPFFTNYGQDSLQGIMYNQKGDTIYFDIGFSVSTLTEKEPKVLFVPYVQGVDRKSLVDTKLFDTSGLVIADKEDFDLDSYRLQNVFFNHVDSLIFKNTIPRIAGNGGIVGIYCDSLKSCNGGVLKFNLYKRGGKELVNDSLYLKLFRTIKFKNKPMCY